MNDFIKRLRKDTVVGQLRELADKIEKGDYVSDITMQELDELLTSAMHEKENGIDFLQPLDQLQASVHEFATSIQHATSQQAKNPRLQHEGIEGEERD